jgi:Undecaprenyl-phosphate galactose phosphotransferase WbaP
LIDIVVSASVLGLLAPVLLLIAGIIKFSDPGPVLFSHQRIGRGGKSFRAWKFRSMVTHADDILEHYLQVHPELLEEWNRDHKLKDDPRITSIGRLLRKTSMDELPQLWNVLVGEMSLVGPRPIVDAEVDKYGETFREYLRVTPGITGLWQISGRNNTTYAERLAYDEFYVRHWSPWLDIYILLRTIKTVFLCEGAY